MSNENFERSTFLETPKLKSTDPVVMELWVKAGGRCSFNGCNKHLLKDRLTSIQAKIGDIAHIVGRKKDAARGAPTMY